MINTLIDNGRLLAVKSVFEGVKGGGGVGAPVEDNVVLPTDPTGFTDIASILSKLLPYIYVVAGLILLLMLIAGGIGLMTSAGNPDKSKASYGKITGALIGFLIIFVSYFVAKIVEVVFGVKFM